MTVKSGGLLLDRQTIASSIMWFAYLNGLLIHPGQKIEHWVDLLIKKGGACPCVPGRDHCPCALALEDIEELGRCRCGLFCNDAYAREYNSLKAKEKERGRWSRKQRASS